MAKYIRVLVLHTIMYNAARIQELITPNYSTVYVLGSNTYSHEGKQTAVSVFCPVNVTLHTMIQIKSLHTINMCRFKTQVHIRYPEQIAP